MSEQMIPQPTDTLIIDDGVIEKITGVVAREIDGILDMKWLPHERLCHQPWCSQQILQRGHRYR